MFPIVRRALRVAGDYAICDTHAAEGMMKVYGCLCLAILALATSAAAQTKQDEAAVRALPNAFSAAFNKHDAHALAAIMTEDVDFVTVGLTWLPNRADFEKYHARLMADRFKDITHKVLETNVKFLRPDVAVVRHSWAIQGDKNVDGSARQPRFGLMTMVAEKRNGTWLVSQVQNVNAGTERGRTPEASDIKSPIVVPKPK
jgi:uncharacterized protein (TIGR02246 family)